jgi:hypothetical protein
LEESIIIRRREFEGEIDYHDLIPLLSFQMISNNCKVSIIMLLETNDDFHFEYSSKKRRNA